MRGRNNTVTSHLLKCRYGVFGKIFKTENAAHVVDRHVKRHYKQSYGRQYLKIQWHETTRPFRTHCTDKKKKKKVIISNVTYLRPIDTYSLAAKCSFGKLVPALEFVDNA